MNAFSKKLLIYSIFFIFNISRFIFPKIINANVIINEVYPNPNTNEKEWIEIFNNSQEIIDLSGWKLMDELSSPSIIFDFDQELEGSFLVEPASFLIIELNNSKLNNSGDSVKLINNNDEIIDQLDYIDSESEMSFSLVLNNETDVPAIVLSIPSKGLPNPTAEDSKETSQNTTQNFPDLLISEVMACPEDSNPEWIEIKNPSNEIVNLNNWQIEDAANNQVILTAEEILPNETIKIFLTNSILNNSGDTVYLFDPNKNLVNKFVSNECVKNSQSTTVQNTSNTPSTDSPAATPPFTKNKQDFSEDSTSVIAETKESRLKKISSLIKIINSDKSSSAKVDNYISKQVAVRPKTLHKSSIISVIIGGAMLSSSGLLFINNGKN